ncbi:MAG TPA: hypothetical protein VKB81_17600 [Nitrospira sp.]|nr:hypothetical protein [Nitrospira sp.]
MDWQGVQATLTQVVEEAFPELYGTRVELRRVGPAWQRFFICITSPFASRIYAVRSALEMLPGQVLRGLLAHELMHVLQFYPLSRLQRLWLAIQYVLSTRARIRLERAADVGVIDRGCGEDLLAMRRYADAQHPDRRPSDPRYLTADEIRVLIERRKA